MQLVITASNGTRRCDWGAFALLRDNVQHFIDSGTQSGQFQALYGVAGAVDGGVYRVDAVRLRSEVFKAWCALRNVKLESAAISRRTHALLRGRPTYLVVGETLQACSLGWPLPVEGDPATPVPKAAGSFIKSVLLLTQTATAGDTLEISVEGRARSALASPQRAGFNMAWLPPLFAICLLVATSCATAPSLPAVTAVKPLSEQQPTSESVAPEAESPLVAPPPAYGNKVVDRSGERARTQG